METSETHVSRSKSEEELEREQLRAQIGDAINLVDSMEAKNKEYLQDPEYNEALGKLQDLAERAVQQGLGIKFNPKEFGRRKRGIAGELSDNTKTVIKEAGYDPDAPDFIGLSRDRLEMRLEEKGYAFILDKEAKGGSTETYFLRPEENPNQERKQ